MVLPGINKVKELLTPKQFWAYMSIHFIVTILYMVLTILILFNIWKILVK